MKVCITGMFRKRMAPISAIMCPSPPKNAPPPPPKADPPPCHKPESVGNFLRQLLPGHFDTSDLIIVLLLLLLCGDSEEEKNTAMLTLALYLFM